MMTVADRWRRVALIREALNELAAHVPVIQRTQRELEQVKLLSIAVERLVTSGVNNHPATFRLVCELLDLEPAVIRRNLGL